MSNIIKRPGIRGCIVWVVILAMFVFSYGVPIGSGIRTALAADENAVEAESNTKKLC